MEFTLNFEDTSVGRKRYEECLRLVRSRSGAVGGEKDQTSFEDQKKEAKLLRALRSGGEPKDWLAEVRKEMAKAPDNQDLVTLLERMERGDDPRVAEPEPGMPETRDYVLRAGGATITLEFDEKEYLLRRLKEARWFPDWAAFGVDLVESVAGLQGVAAGGEMANGAMAKANKPHQVKSA